MIAENIADDLDHVAHAWAEDERDTFVTQAQRRGYNISYDERGMVSVYSADYISYRVTFGELPNHPRRVWLTVIYSALNQGRHRANRKIWLSADPAAWWDALRGRLENIEAGR